MATTFRRVFVLGVVAAAIMFLVSRAHAGTSTSNMTVSANVVASCSISAGPLAFGNYDPIVANASSDLAGTATLTVACTSGSSTNIGCDNGANYSTTRRMKNGTTNYLSYGLYSDSAHTTAWGNVSGSWVAYTGTGTPGSVTVYGLVTHGQTAAVVGSYSDTVVVTVNF